MKFENIYTSNPTHKQAARSKLLFKTVVFLTMFKPILLKIICVCVNVIKKCIKVALHSVKHYIQSPLFSSLSALDSKDRQ